ncbi:hypothetical protein GCM10017786_01670 [Amycolatopsis deserti]|uniref:Uncharacterized protein n=1 Tax=Amycolatopsis deserti TaxID=185696 RepID=A0ABQ3ICE0_9PSEU|nr:dihydrodipicolinate synthase family protein [Amycolatopsis deserti]GHE76345.1 hypothetical protein GCM10017786_01670 [Amycolatopsis deserti]
MNWVKQSGSADLVAAALRAAVDERWRPPKLNATDAAPATRTGKLGPRRHRGSAGVSGALSRESGDLATARDLYYRLHPPGDLLFGEINEAPPREALQQRGLIQSGSVRQPLVPLAEDGQVEVEKRLAAGAELLPLVASRLT